jgi:hypothetical protein
VDYSTGLSLKGEIFMSCKKNCNKSYANVDFDFGSPNRFDLETAITNNMNVTDNLKTIIEDVLEGNGIALDPDQLVNTLQGVINLHTMQHNKLWDTFINLFQLDKSLDELYNDETESEDEEEYNG